jgi:hypothetical protein
MTQNKPRKFKRPNAPLIGANGNVFNLIAIAGITLKEHGYPDKASEMSKRVQESKSYEEALAIIQEYVEPVER